MRRLLLNSTLFPYTTLFRSCKLLDQLLCLPILGPVFKVTFLDVKSIRFCGRHRLGNDDGITELHFPFTVTLAVLKTHHVIIGHSESVYVAVRRVIVGRHLSCHVSSNEKGPHLCGPQSVNYCVCLLIHALAVSLARRLARSEEHTSELQSRENLVCRLLLEKKKLTCQRSTIRG